MLKKILIRSIVTLLLVSFIFSLAACGETGTTTTTSSSTNTEKPYENYPAQLIGLKDQYDDTTVEIVYVEGAAGTYTADSIWVDPEAGVIDDVKMGVIERNNQIQEDLGVTIEPVTDQTLGIDSLYSYAKVFFDTQDPSLDVYAGYQYFDIGVATSGHLMNLKSIVNNKGETIIDTSREYWASNYINSITYNDNMFWVTGDLALRYIGGLYCTFVNLELYDLYVRNNYENKSIYDIVDSGNWTMKTMLDMANMVYDDSDNSGTASELDRLGIVFETCDVMDGYSFGCDVSYSKKSTIGGKDSITIEINKDSKASDLAAFLDTMVNSNYAYNAGNDSSKLMMPIYAAGDTLFCLNQISMAEVYLSEMSSYGIIPPPKLNTSQTNYTTGVHDSVTLFGISKWSDCPELSAATLELMAYYGKTLVADVYYEKVLKGSRVSQDDESSAMIEKIRDGFDTDFAAAWSHSIGNIVHIYRTPSNLKQFSTFIKISSREWPGQLAELTAQLEQAVLEE